MKHRLFSKTAIGVVLAGAAVLAMDSAMAGPMTSIADSWHNLGANNRKGGTPNDPANGNPNKSMATGEICVFCHTPHGGDTSAAVPIWNRKLNAATVYQGTRYSDNNTTTFDAAEGPIGSVTIACLSCHDGAQAVDALINAPGSGGYTDPEKTPFGDPSYYQWANGVRFAGADAVNGMLAPGIVQNLGTDLRNDHPVSMQYAGGGITGSGGQIATNVPRDPDFTTDTPRTIIKANGAGQYNVVLKSDPHTTLDTIFYIDRGSESLVDGARDRKDIIFYTRNFTPPASSANNKAGVQPFVECGSCHDPHNVSNPTFLRVSNGIPSSGTLATQFPAAVNDAPSGLCLTCHAK